MTDMKIFSSLLAFVMMFACLSVAYADVAPYPRPRPELSETQFVTAEINNFGKLSVELEFPYDCSYKYRLVDKNTGKEILSGKGKYTEGDTVEESANLLGRLSVGENFFVLTIETFDIKAQTRFGTKTRRDKYTAIKTLVVTKNLHGKPYKVQVYDSERD